MWPMGPSENDIQARMSEIERYRQSGQAIDASQMDAAGQQALKRLMGGAQAMMPGQAQAPPSPTPLPVSSTTGIRPQQPDVYGGPSPAGSPILNKPAQITPQQGGVWADAEAEQRKRALAGVPMVR